MQIIGDKIEELTRARDQLFDKLFFAAWLLVFSYGCFYFYHGARVVLVMISVGAFLVCPIIFLLKKIKFERSARLLFFILGNSLIYLTSLSLKQAVNAEIYYIPAALLGFLLFKPFEKWMIRAAILLPSSLWVITVAFGYSFAPESIFTKDPPIELLRNVSCIAAFAISIYFVRMFFYSIGSLQDFIVSQAADKRQGLEHANALLEENAKLLHESQRVAKLGHWTFTTQTRVIKWSEQMFAIFSENIALGEPSYERHYQSIHADDRERWQQVVMQCLQASLKKSIILMV